MTTNLSQGACQGIEDVLVLSDALAGTSTIPEALQSYQARRLPRITPLARRSRRVAAVGGWSGLVTASVRNRVMGRALGGAALRDHMTFVATNP
jgi:2-polyprenyl-6-methoxyphenol hydroxylase-like FAD-dependent oxidoreductase